MKDERSRVPSQAHNKKPIQPEFPETITRPNKPETLEELFRVVALSASASVRQPDPGGKKAPKKQEYTLPWPQFQSWRDARERLQHFEEKLGARLSWAPFNDSMSNDGPMSLNAYPGRAFIERVTNAGDANLEGRAINRCLPMPSSPAEAVTLWFDLGPKALSSMTRDQALDLAKNAIAITGFIGDSKDHRDSIFDARDYGIGLSSAEMPNTILSLNRGNKKSKPWLTGKHGQGASSTYQYSDLTLIASRKIGRKSVAFTFVEAAWDDENGVQPKTPTYKFMTIDGKVPEIELPPEEFRAGTLVRHIGYNAADLFNLIGENSLYGLLMRSLAEPLFPVWLEIFDLRNGKSGGLPTFRGYRRYGRVIRGSVNALERAWSRTLTTSNVKVDSGVPDNDNTDVDEVFERAPEDSESARIMHRASEYYQLPQWDYGARAGRGELGRVKINYWVVDPAGRSTQDILRNFADPDKTILMTLDGQTHAEESRAIITGQRGAKLWAVGRCMIVQIDCNSLDSKAKYEMFTSTREHAKETPIKKMILDELVQRLSFDTKLQELNTQLAAADIKQPENSGDTIASLIKKYLKTAGVSFEQLTRKLDKWVESEEYQTVRVKDPEVPPIAAVEPPTFIRWKFRGTSVRMYPGQRYSFQFETDASPSYWNPEDQTTSKIKVTAHTVRYIGAGEMKSGRVRCHFECLEGTAIGAKGFAQVQMEFAMGASKTSLLPIEVVEKPVPREKSVTPDEDVEQANQPAKVIRVKVRKKDFSEVEIPVVRPIPLTRTENAWATLGWPHDPNRVGFSIRSLGGKVHLYYNAEFPPFLELRRKMSKRSLESEFVRRYELKLVLHTIFTLNYDFADEEDFVEPQKKQIRDLLCATAESLALATKSELEIESKLKSEDSTPLETTLVSSRDAAADPSQEATAS